MEMDDDTLTAMALREHAQTCDDIAARASSEGRKAWTRRAERCRELARRHETAAKFLRVAVPEGQA